MSYTAKVCRIQNVRPHPNADRLKLCTVAGHQIVVGLEQEEGELGVFFEADGQLSEEMCAANDLIERKNPDTGEREGGYFAKNRRVRAQNLRGEKSEGYWTSLDSLKWTKFDVSKLPEGYEFTELNGKPVCNKYVTPATLRAMKQGQSAKRINRCFAEHVDTKQLRFMINDLNPTDTFWITLKMHGTSGRTGLVLEETPAPTSFWQRIKQRQWKPRSEWKYLMGTRHVILADHTVTGYYGSQEFRWNAAEPIIKGGLKKGEVIYYELVGYTTDNQPLMFHDTEKISALKKKYGKTMVYSYNQPEGTCGLYVYRITRVNEDGDAIELPWLQVKARCEELGLKHVPEMGVHNGKRVEELGTQALNEYVESLIDGPDPVAPDKHIREGIVLRTEGVHTRFYKSKGFDFKMLEGIIKEKEDYVDMEEAS